MLMSTHALIVNPFEQRAVPMPTAKLESIARSACADGASDCAADFSFSTDTRKLDAGLSANWLRRRAENDVLRPRVARAHVYVRHVNPGYLLQMASFGDDKQSAVESVPGVDRTGAAAGLPLISPPVKAIFSP